MSVLFNTLFKLVNTIVTSNLFREKGEEVVLSTELRACDWPRRQLSMQSQMQVRHLCSDRRAPSLLIIVIAYHPHRLSLSSFISPDLVWVFRISPQNQLSGLVMQNSCFVCVVRDASEFQGVMLTPQTVRLQEKFIYSKW